MLKEDWGSCEGGLLKEETNEEAGTAEGKRAGGLVV